MVIDITAWPQPFSGEVYVTEEKWYCMSMAQWKIGILCPWHSGKMVLKAQSRFLKLHSKPVSSGPEKKTGILL